MGWVYELENSIHYVYPEEPEGVDHPLSPPTPPAGWPVPRVGDVIGLGPRTKEWVGFKSEVIGIEWDYYTPQVNVLLRVIRDEAGPETDSHKS